MLHQLEPRAGDQRRHLTADRRRPQEIKRPGGDQDGRADRTQSDAAISSLPALRTIRHRQPGRFPGKSRDRPPAAPGGMPERSLPGSPPPPHAYPRPAFSLPARPGRPASVPPCPARPRTSSAGVPLPDDGLPATHRPAIPTPRRSRPPVAPDSARATTRPGRPRHQLARKDRAASPTAQLSAYPPRARDDPSPRAG
jgi:hypothetical protein